MAGRQLSIEDHVTCAVCMDLYDDPVALSCMHSFCRTCLVGIVAASMDLKCPECRKSTKLGKHGVNGLAKNFQLGGIVEMYKRDHELEDSATQERSTTLPPCTQHRVPCHLLCKACNKPACYKCLTDKHKGHKFELDEENEETSGEEVLCEQHSWPYRLYCKNCDAVICLVCFVRKHQSHDLTSLEDRHRSTLEAVRKCLADLEAKRRTFRETNKTCRSLAQKVQSDAQKKRQEVTGYFARLKDMIERREAAIRAELDKKENEAVHAYMHKADLAQKKDAKLNNVIDDIKRLLTEDDVSVIQTYKSRTARAAGLLQGGSSDCPPDLLSGMEDGTLMTCSLEKELAKVHWEWPKQIPELPLERKVPSAPAISRTVSATTQPPKERQPLRINTSVQRGKDWKDGLTDGGPGHFGTVVQTTVDQDVYMVRWPNGKKGSYKYAPPFVEEIMPP